MRGLANLAFALPFLFAGTAQAAYLDDRSTPGALIESLYNALNAREYARAWSYFETGPAESFEAYSQGFSDTTLVRVKTGAPEPDGAAGTTHWKIPAVIEATSGSGAVSVFAGCYDVKLVSPPVQDVPYRPMIIAGSDIKPAAGTFPDAMPAGCGPDAAASAEADLVAQARALLTRLKGDDCDDGALERDPSGGTLEWNYAFDGADAPKRISRVLQFTCRMAAYNIVDMFVLWDKENGLRPISFAQPELDLRYEDDAQEKLKSMTVMGMKTTDELLNAEFSAEEQAITSYDKWRGPGDAGANGKWIFRDGSFTLVTYEVDPTYDGSEDYTTVVDYESAP
ncbi:MAG: DUF1176 domain-containing protein [Notoacmeibacter sp.]|nr:DUF1176 domain-containing protein [Notoacmeibacter sp.]MCC0032727.1 DUF1176 domain-containing protein [Brucellaceae bacterium]